jgi:hypothetical protein
MPLALVELAEHMGTTQMEQTVTPEGKQPSVA